MEPSLKTQYLVNEVCDYDVIILPSFSKALGRVSYSGLVLDYHHEHDTALIRLSSFGSIPRPYKN